MDCKHIQNQSMGFSVAEIRQQKEFCQGVLQLFTSSLRVSSLGSETGCVCCTHLEFPQNLSKYGVFFRSKKVSPKRHLTGFANFCKIPFPCVFFFSVVSFQNTSLERAYHGMDEWCESTLSAPPQLLPAYQSRCHQMVYNYIYMCT